WWWKVAQHLDDAQLALVNAMVHNVDDPRSVHALRDRLREGQAILLEIFHSKGLIPGTSHGGPEMSPTASPSGRPVTSEGPAPTTAPSPAFPPPGPPQASGATAPPMPPAWI